MSDTRPALYHERHKRWPRSAVVQYTDAALRRRVRHSRGLGLLDPWDAKQWRMMAYGVLLERRHKKANA